MAVKDQEGTPNPEPNLVWEYSLIGGFALIFVGHLLGAMLGFAPCQKRVTECIVFLDEHWRGAAIIVGLLFSRILAYKLLTVLVTPYAGFRSNEKPPTPEKTPKRLKREER